ncbi:MAG: hypothetical protein QN168_10255 [Armatimonadota bacterium]|nr:hypothetical protein [Armatimonadota bacterium]
MRFLVPSLVVGLLVSGLAGLTYGYQYYEYAPPARAGQAADVKGQLKTAVTHAGFAGEGNALGYVQQHLGHALNCLEGTRGKNFNQAWGHVCQGMGNGILADLKAAPGGGDFMLLAEQADALAVAGVRSKNLTEARMAAKGVAALLNIIAENLK